MIVPGRPPGDRLMTPADVAEAFQVDPKTVTRWAAGGRLPSVRTPGGHRRFWRSDILALLAGDDEDVSGGDDE